MPQRRRPRRQSKPPATVETTVSIDRLGAQGDGVTSDGVYIPYTLPGETVQARVSGRRGTVLEIVSTSADRVEAPCPHFGTCGGCALQHVDAKTYSAWKRRQIVEALTAEGFEAPKAAAPIQSKQQTRRRAVFAAERDQRAWRIGFHGRRSTAVTALESCLILHPDLFAGLATAQELLSCLPDRNRTASLHVTATENGLDMDIEAQGLAPDTAPPMVLQDMIETARDAGFARLTIGGDTAAAFHPAHVKLADVPVAIPPKAFLQATVSGEAALQHLAVEAAKGAKRIADLFAGCGTFTFALAKTASVTAVESDGAALEALAAAARQAPGLKPIATERRDLFRRPLSTAELAPFDAVLFDPPRAGAEAQAREIAASGVPTVIAVSCNPKTFARDGAILRGGGYTLETVTPVDQFLFSPHIECIGVFRKG